MKLKYFLRGLGAGIVFATLIMLVAYMTSGGYKLSDDEIIKRAEKLGMVMEEKTPLPTLTDSDEEPTTENVDDEDTQVEISEEVTEDITAIEVTTEDVTTEEVTTEDDIDAEVEPSIEDTNPDDTYVEATIEVVSGMGSYQIAQLLEDAGIIEDAADFDAFLNANGYSTKLKVNTYTFNSDMTYEEIAEKLIKEDKK